MADAETCHVPNLARIVDLLGGLDRIEDGDSYVISIDPERVILPEEDDAETLDIVFPELRKAGESTVLPLHITRFDTDGDEVTLQVGFGYGDDGDGRYRSLRTFRVGATTWRSGRWTCLGLENVSALGQIAREASGIKGLGESAEFFDSQDISVAAALRIAERFGNRN